MKQTLKAVVGKLPICIYLSVFSTVAAAQGTGAIVESRSFTPGQATSQGGSSSAAAVNNDALQLLLEQNQQLQTEVQALRGIIEEQGFELRKLQRDALTRYSNTDERLSALEAAAARNTASLSPGTSAPNTSTPLTSPAPISTTTPVSTTAPIANTAANSAPLSAPATAPATAVRTPITNQAPAITSGASNQAAAIASTTIPEAPANSGAAANRSSGRGTGTLQPAVLSEQQLYQMAYDSVINSNFERSIAEFDQYLSIYPNGRFVTNAHYWKGQAYLYLNRYEEARAAYEIIIDQYADSPKLPDAMYGLGLAYQGLGNIQQARRLLTDIKRRFPNTGVANLADTRLLSLD